MADNYFSFAFDERAETERSYQDLTDDDIKYIEAAVRHDYDTTDDLLFRYFRKKMPNTRCKHEVYRRDNKKDIWVYKIIRRKKRDAGWLGTGVYFYGAEEEAVKAVEYGLFLQSFYINVEHPFTIDRDLHRAIVRANSDRVSDRITEYLSKHEVDGVFWPGDMREEWCVHTPYQIKRSGITRDDDGRIIPISRRFDLSNPDNRF